MTVKTQASLTASLICLGTLACPSSKAASGVSELLAWWAVQGSKVRLVHRERCCYLSCRWFGNALKGTVLGMIPLEEEMVQNVGEDVNESAVLRMQKSCQGVCAFVRRPHRWIPASHLASFPWILKLAVLVNQGLGQLYSRPMCLASCKGGHILAQLSVTCHNTQMGKLDITHLEL